MSFEGLTDLHVASRRCRLISARNIKDNVILHWFFSERLGLPPFSPSALPGFM